MGGNGGIDLVQQLDKTLALRAREHTGLRLRLGQLLELIGRGGVFDLGFSSVGAYALERCERSVRWTEGARCLARRLEELPELRREMAAGRISWSMGELVARVATPGDELRWLERAASRTVRQMRALAAAARPASAAKVAPPGAVEGEGAPISSLRSDDELCTLTCTVDQKDAWLFEATRCALDQLGTRGMAEQSEALLAEAQTTLLALLPEDARIELDAAQPRDEAQRRWLDQLARWREEAEALCERGILRELLTARGSGETGPSCPRKWPQNIGLEASLGMAPLRQVPCTVLDRQVRALAETLARRELDLALLVLRFHRADGWRKLGYATEAQYARERLGLSRSSLVARRALALRLEKLPQIAAALGAAEIGVEAAVQLVRIATPRTEAAWLERARHRTIKHLREEVAAGLTAGRMSGEQDCLPPADAELKTYQALEQAVVSGRFGDASPVSDELDSEPRRAWYLMLSSLTSWLNGGLLTSAAAPGAPGVRARSSVGRVTLRLRMTRDTYAWWRGLEAQAKRWLPRDMSWLQFLCISLWRGWRHLLGAEVAYGHVYVRDRYRCTSPVCNRRDVTPHHLVFRSAGGSDEDYNIASICTWCHLHGVHGGRIRATGTAGQIRWELGARSAPCLIVQGRKRVAA